jgi:acyl dehydratase
MARRELTDADFEEASRLVGVQLRRTMYGGSNTCATRDTIVRFCDGISDENPLHRDRDYAGGTPYGRLVAPPLFLLSVDRGIGAPGLPGVQYINGGTSHTFYRPILEDENLTATRKLVDVQWKEGRTAGRFIDQVCETQYFVPETGEPVASSLHHVFRIPRRETASDAGYQAQGIHHYSQDEVDQIWAGIDAEEIRGAKPRYWEDVEIGSALVPLVKPVLSITDILQWYAGVGCLYQAHEMAWKHRRRHPGDSHLDERTGVPGHPGRGHLEGDMARAAGMPGVYDVGNQRLSWLGQLVEYWAGDLGWVTYHDVKIRRPNVEGDTSWCLGEVTGKTEVDSSAGECTVSVRVVNQRDEATCDGVIRVRLPRR